MNPHGGARKGAGRKPSLDNQKIRAERIQDQLKEKVEAALIRMGEKAGEIVDMMIEYATRTGNKQVTCSKCGHVTEVVMPMADTKTQQWLMNTLLRTQDLGEESSNFDAVRRIIEATKENNELAVRAVDEGGEPNP